MLWVAIGAEIMKRLHLCVIHLLFFPIPFLTADTTRFSIGAGLALSTRENALMANTSGCGLHYLLRQYYTSHCISGRGASFIGGNADQRVEYAQRRAALKMLL